MATVIERVEELRHDLANATDVVQAGYDVTLSFLGNELVQAHRDYLKKVMKALDHIYDARRELEEIFERMTPR